MEGKTTMDTFERNATRALAIAYHAYMQAGPDNWQPWAKLLIQAQRDTGVELLPVSTLLYGPAPDADAAPVDVTPELTPEPEPWRNFAGYDGPGAQSTRKRKPSDDEGDGGALVPAPKPTPRKPSPGVAEQARQWAIQRALRSV